MADRGGGNIATDWHGQTGETCLARLVSSADGLGEEEARRRHLRFGANRLPVAKGRSWLNLLAGQFASALVWILIVAAAATAALGHGDDAIVILAVIVANAAIGMIQEGRSENALAAIRKLLAPRATVLRDARRIETDAALIVPGDIVLLAPGDAVPADLRLLSAQGLRLEEALLTGESLPADKMVAGLAPQTPLAERANMAYAGTTVANGFGTGVVVAIGTATEAGRIGRMLTAIEPLATPLTRQLERFGRWLTAAVILFAGAVFAFGVLFWKMAPVEAMLAAVGLGVAAVPEALPAVMTVTLAIGVQRMAQRKAIVRRLPAVETLGCVNVICTDKTGTLTRNEMTVQAIVTGEGDYVVAGIGYETEGAVTGADGPVLPAQIPQGLGQLLEIALLCNDASLRLGAKGEVLTAGDPTELALLVMGAKLGRSQIETTRAAPRVDALPFLSERGWMATRHRCPDGASEIFLKGAPERVIAMIDDPQARDEWRAATDRLARRGLRVLGFARRRSDDRPLTEPLAEGFEMIGLVGMWDPPRAEAIAAIASCRTAGIAVKMITGDHADTARAVARALDFARPDSVLTGADLDRLADADLGPAVAGTDVFARTGPEHKLRLVRALQAGGAVVAMTGDGVNDAPALKQADVGIAMGRGGTEAAKEAAQLVLTDDNFASIVAAVEEGRTVYGNLKKTILYLLPTNGGEAGAIVVALALGMTLPITALQILWINLVTEVTLTLALAFEPALAAAMRLPPRPRREALLSGALLWRLALVTALMLLACFGNFFLQIERGATLAEARSCAVNALVAVEIAYLLNIRRQDRPAREDRRRNPALWPALVGIVLLQATFTYAPPFQRWFDTAAIGPLEWAIVAATGLGAYLIVEVECALRRGRCATV